jgi:hypothetical protein
MSQTIDDLRSALFDTLGDLRDTTKKVDLDRARMMVDVCKAILDTAKVETDRIRVTGRPADTGFIPIVTAHAPVKMVGVVK